MASRGKKTTTMAKLNRETRLRERRLIKEARKPARSEPRPADEAQPRIVLLDAVSTARR
jgi:hypothetical protein